MNKTTFHIPKMDCAAEEQMIRMKLQGDEAVKNLMIGTIAFILVIRGALRILSSVANRV